MPVQCMYNDDGGGGSWWKVWSRPRPVLTKWHVLCSLGCRGLRVGCYQTLQLYEIVLLLTNRHLSLLMYSTWMRCMIQYRFPSLIQPLNSSLTQHSLALRCRGGTGTITQWIDNWNDWNDIGHTIPLNAGNRRAPEKKSEVRVFFSPQNEFSKYQYWNEHINTFFHYTKTVLTNPIVNLK